MSDTSLNKFLQIGTNADRLAFTPSAPTATQGYLFFTTDTLTLYAWDGAAWNAVTGGGSASELVQIVNTQTGTVASGATQLPFDSTIPQNTEGDEYMTLAITPANALNILRIEALGFFSVPTTNVQLSMALFQDATANALAVSTYAVGTGGAGKIFGVYISHRMVAGTASATTFKIRAGMNSAGTTTFNGISAAGPYFNNLLTSMITITEVLP
jgi:hypothetical protein